MVLHKKSILVQFVSDLSLTMVMNTEHWEIVRRVEAFVGITDDVIEDPTLVNLLTQIVNLRQVADNS